MSALPADTAALLATAFALGVRHGFDADHLAAIDGLARRSGRSAGLLFAAGHGVVVLAVAGAMGAAQAHWAAPPWLDSAGAWVSVLLLAALGLANLHALHADRPLPVGLRSRWVRGSAFTVGALFALSFDTLTLAALFGSTQPALAAALAFVAGMALVDGANGWWVARLLRQRAVARAVGWAVAAASLGVAAFGIARMAWPQAPGWPASAAVLAAVAVAWAAARVSARGRPAPSPAP